MRFLIVDDSSTMRRIVANTLNKLGYPTPVEAANGREALERLGVEAADIIITDWNMPEMNGVEFVQAVRKMPATKHVPVLMITTNAGKADIVEALNAGVTSYVVKPFTPDTVSLLPLVPVVQVAWAEGGVTAAERTALVTLARSRGIEAGSAADAQLAQWLDAKPSDTVFASATRLIRAMLDASAQPNINADDLVAYCERIAAASGGMLGIRSVSAEERALLASITADLKGRR